jgi:hippurate hydrolase
MSKLTRLREFAFWRDDRIDITRPRAARLTSRWRIRYDGLTLSYLLTLVSTAFLSAAPSDLRTGIDKEYGALENLYRELHAHPELSLHEKETAARLTQQLRTSGFEVTEQVGGHGFVAVLRNGTGPTVLVRTDLDALPVKEDTGLAYASQVTTRDDAGKDVNVMHACGHDVHMTVFVGTARLLAAQRAQWHGTLVFVGQPAEERGVGARAMIQDGLFKRFPKPDYALALHVNAEIPAGTVGVTEGFFMANVDSVDILIRGVGGHGAFPHTTKDPIVIAAQTILALQTIVSREVNPVDSAVITVGSIHAGTKHNIIPSEAKLQLTVRSFSDGVRAHLLEAIRRVARGTASAAGVPEDLLPTVSVVNESTPAAYNNPELTHRLANRFREALGSDQVLVRQPVMGGEDFGLFGRTEDRIPICMFWLGAVDPARMRAATEKGEGLPSLHSAFFAPQAEPTLKTGVLAMTSAVLDLLGNEK